MSAIVAFFPGNDIRPESRRNNINNNNNNNNDDNNNNNNNNNSNRNMRELEITVEMVKKTE